MLGLPGGWEIGLGWFSQVVVIVWIVGVTNAINLIDGLDGLAGGVVAIISASFFAYSLMQGNELAAVAIGQGLRIQAVGDQLLGAFDQ